MHTRYIPQATKTNDVFGVRFPNPILHRTGVDVAYYRGQFRNMWMFGSNMLANAGGRQDTIYTSRQLTSPDYPLSIKSNTHSLANFGVGNEKRIALTYIHNPNKYEYSINIGAWGQGLTFTTPNTVYTAKRYLTYTINKKALPSFF